MGPVTKSLGQKKVVLTGLMVDTSEDVFVVEGVNGSNPADQLRGVDGLGLQVDGGVGGCKYPSS